MLPPASRATVSSMRRSLWAGAAVASLLSFGVGGWAATTQVSSAVIAPGLLVVDTNVKKVQHRTGGVVGELRVKDGMPVTAGDILLRLDETVTRANLGVITRTMDELYARQARLQAEQDGLAIVSFPASLVTRIEDPTIARLLSEEARLFASRRAAKSGLSKQLRERIEQIKEQIRGIAEQAEAKKREVELIRKELTGVRELWRKNLIQMPRLTALEREEARLDGERGALVSSIAQAKGRMAEIELQIIQIDQDMAKEVGKEIGEIRARLSELAERRIAAEDDLMRVDIRAPQTGIVHQLAVHTIGGVINPGEPILLIVPRTDVLLVETRIAPQDVDQVRVGQEAFLRFPAFNQRTTPELNGKVTFVSADISQDPKTGLGFYSVKIDLSQEELDRLNGLRLVPGMPVEAFIRTGDRTIVSYLTKPLTDQIFRAWREK